MAPLSENARQRTSLWRFPKYSIAALNPSAVLFYNTSN